MTGCQYAIARYYYVLLRKRKLTEADFLFIQRIRSLIRSIEEREGSK